MGKRLYVGNLPFSYTSANLESLFASHGTVTSAQVVLRWHIEHRIVAIPRSASGERIAENADIFGFALTSSEVEILDSFGSGWRVR